MTSIVIQIVLLILFIDAWHKTLIHQAHMFQLNEYALDTHTRWMGKNRKEFVLPIAAIIAAAITAVPQKTAGAACIIGMALLYILFAIRAFRRTKTKAKIKLAYTGRVKRMMTTSYILMVILMLPCILAGMGINCMPALGYAVLLFLNPWILMIASKLNMPIEKSINKGFIDEAKAILKDAPDMKIIGITGSYGKTSMKYYLTSLLKAQYDVLMTPGNFNTTLGVVRTIREHYTPFNEIFVCEMGARRVGEIKEICDLVHPDAGIITSIGPQHLETFHTLDNVKKTKYELANSLTPASPLFLNGDDENIMTWPHREDAIIYGIDNHAGYYADNISADDQGSRFTVHTPDGREMDFKTRLLGRHNVLNITGAIAVAHTMGIELKALVPKVRKLEGVPHRLQFRKDNKGAIIDDAYNSNPSGTRAALEVLGLFDGLKMMVTPGMVELGDKQDELNYEFGQNAAAVCDYVALVGEAQTRPIYEGLISAGYPQEKIIVASNFNQAMKRVEAIPTAGQKRYILLENDLPDNY